MFSYLHKAGSFSLSEVAGPTGINLSQCDANQAIKYVYDRSTRSFGSFKKAWKVVSHYIRDDRPWPIEDAEDVHKPVAL